MGLNEKLQTLCRELQARLKQAAVRAPLPLSRSHPAFPLENRIFSLLLLVRQANEEVFREEEAAKRKELTDKFQGLVDEFTKRMDTHMVETKAVAEDNNKCAGQLWRQRGCIPVKQRVDEL